MTKAKGNESKTKRTAFEVGDCTHKTATTIGRKSGQKGIQIQGRLIFIWYGMAAMMPYNVMGVVSDYIDEQANSKWKEDFGWYGSAAIIAGFILLIFLNRCTNVTTRFIASFGCMTLCLVGMGCTFLGFPTSIVAYRIGFALVLVLAVFTSIIGGTITGMTYCLGHEYAISLFTGYSSTGLVILILDFINTYLEEKRIYSAVCIGMCGFICFVTALTFPWVVEAEESIRKYVDLCDIRWDSTDDLTDTIFLDDPKDGEKSRIFGSNIIIDSEDIIPASSIHNSTIPDLESDDGFIPYDQQPGLNDDVRVTGSHNPKKKHKKTKDVLSGYYTHISKILLMIWTSKAALTCAFLGAVETGSIVPGIIVFMKPNESENFSIYVYHGMLFLFFMVFDIFGRGAASFTESFRLVVVWVMTFVRLFFIPLFVWSVYLQPTTHVLSSIALRTSLFAFFGFSNGWVASLACIRVPDHMKGRKTRESSGALAGLFVNFGVAVGSALGLLFVAF